MRLHDQPIQPVLALNRLKPIVKFVLINSVCTDANKIWGSNNICHSKSFFSEKTNLYEIQLNYTNLIKQSIVIFNDIRFVFNVINQAAVIFALFKTKVMTKWDAIKE